MADISDNVVVSQMDCVNGDTMLTINKMMSTVFNIYNQRAIQIGAQWDETNHNTSNTIDRYFESFDLKVILDFHIWLDTRKICGLYFGIRIMQSYTMNLQPTRSTKLNI